MSDKIKFDQFKTLESTQTFFKGVPDDCKKNILQVLGNDISSRKILEYYLFENWADVIGASDRKRTDKLTTKEYVLSLEIISEAKNIPHRFESLLFRIFYDGNKQGFEEMRKPEFVDRTAVCIQKIMSKMDLELTNPYSSESDKSRNFNETLEDLRKEKKYIDYSDYKKVKEYYGKYNLLQHKCEMESRRRFEMEN